MYAHEALHVVRLPVLDEEVHEEDGDEKHDRFEVREEERQVVVCSTRHRVSAAGPGASK